MLFQRFIGSKIADDVSLHAFGWILDRRKRRSSSENKTLGSQNVLDRWAAPDRNGQFAPRGHFRVRQTMKTDARG
jgi:hypothetical protein